MAGSDSHTPAGGLGVLAIGSWVWMSPLPWRVSRCAYGCRRSGASISAITSVFPAGEQVRHFLKSQSRKEDFVALVADEGATYDHTERIDLSELVPVIALPTSPGNVVPVSNAAGEPIAQVYIDSPANPG